MTTEEQKSLMIAGLRSGDKETIENTLQDLLEKLKGDSISARRFAEETLLQHCSQIAEEFMKVCEKNSYYKLCLDGCSTVYYTKFEHIGYDEDYDTLTLLTATDCEEDWHVFIMPKSWLFIPESDRPKEFEKMVKEAKLEELQAKRDDLNHELSNICRKIDAIEDEIYKLV